MPAESTLPPKPASRKTTTSSPNPRQLPSDAKAKRKPTAPRSPSPGESLRSLERLETAYRVTYRRFGQVITEDHDDLNALRTLLASQGSNLTVKRVEPIDLGGRTKSVLLEASSSAS